MKQLMKDPHENSSSDVKKEKEDFAAMENYKKQIEYHHQQATTEGNTIDQTNTQINNKLHVMHIIIVH